MLHIWHLLSPVIEDVDIQNFWCWFHRPPPPHSHSIWNLLGSPKTDMLASYISDIRWPPTRSHSIFWNLAVIKHNTSNVMALSYSAECSTYRLSLCWFLQSFVSCLALFGCIFPTIMFTVLDFIDCHFRDTGKDVLHYHIHSDGKLQYIAQKHTFNSIPDMIHYHRLNSAGWNHLWLSAEKKPWNACSQRRIQVTAPLLNPKNFLIEAAICPKSCAPPPPRTKSWIRPELMLAKLTNGGL